MFSLSRSGTFDLGSYPRGQSRSHQFNQVGLVKVYCHIHSHMSASIMVFDHRFFTIPDREGTFALDDVPPGTYRVSAWHERIGENTQTVTVVPGGTADLQVHAADTLQIGMVSGRQTEGRPPRFVTRTMSAIFMTVGFMLLAVMLVVTLIMRERVRSTVIDHVSSEQQTLTELELRRTQEMQAQIDALAESPTIAAAMDTYRAEASLGGAAGERVQLLATVARELDRLADRIHPDVIAAVDPQGGVVAVAGRRSDDWPRAMSGVAAPARGFLSLPAGVFRVASAPLVVQQSTVGTLQMATRLDAEYARQLSALSGTQTVITANGIVSASTLPDSATRALTPQTMGMLGSTDTVRLNGTLYTARVLLRRDNVAVYTLESVDASTAQILDDTLRALLVIALASLAAAAVASLMLARSVAKPIDRLSRSLTAIARSRDFDTPVPALGAYAELDDLTETFNGLMTSVSAAEAETRRTYVGAIRALALALDARDQYTAGHSERVSAMSVAVGTQLGLAGLELETVRLGALLHDIGKIGVSDAVLHKPGPLTPAEFEMIKEHPVTGARILRSVAFLAPHLPIVELHHERPDGKGYPHGLRADEIPLHARIVHVVDAFDAMTSARAYRPAWSTTEALQELWRCAGTQFDAEAVQALVAALPNLHAGGDRDETLGARAAAGPRLSLARP